MKTYYLFSRNCFLSHPHGSFFALALAYASLTFASPEANTPVPVTGGFFPCFTYAGAPRQVGDNIIVRFNTTSDVTGAFTGQDVGDELDIIHRDGSINIHGTALFTGALNGGPSGTLLFTYSGIGSAVTGHASLQIVGAQGTGGLAGVHFQGTIEANLVAPNPGCDASGVATYTGQVVFVPR